MPARKKALGANVTLRDVGLAAGVSYQTVSRVVNDLSGVSEATRKRVLKAARKLGYHPNRVAGSLRTSRSKVIGLIMADIENFFFAEVVGGVEAEASARGYSVILANSSEDLDRERRAALGLMERRVDGLIIAPTGGDHSYLRTDLPKNFPLVAINRAIDARPCGAVLTDNEPGATAAVRYLIDRGHKEIGAIVASQTLMTSRERFRGYKAAMDAAGLPVRPEWVGTGGFTPESGFLAAINILSRKDRPTALFASSNRIAEGVLLALQQLNLRRNQDIEIVGFDNAPWAKLVDPPVAVIAQPAREIGQRAVQMLLETIDKGGLVPRTLRLAPQFITNDRPGTSSLLEMQSGHAERLADGI